MSPVLNILWSCGCQTGDVAWMYQASFFTLSGFTLIDSHDLYLSYCCRRHDVAGSMNLEQYSAGVRTLRRKCPQ
jgi:hypothetical protein